MKCNHITYGLKTNHLYTKHLVKSFITKFWKEHVSLISDNQHILLLFRVNYINNQTKTIGTLKSLNKEDKDIFTKFIHEMMNFKDEDYKTIPIFSFTFSYYIKEGKAPIKISENVNYTFQIYYKNKLPVAFDPIGYGEILNEDNNTYLIKHDGNTLIKVSQFTQEDGTKYNKVIYYKNLNELFKWKDIYTTENSFTRELGKSIYTFERENVNSPYVLVFHKKILPAKLMTKLKSRLKHN